MAQLKVSMNVKYTVWYYLLVLLSALRLKVSLFKVKPILRMYIDGKLQTVIYVDFGSMEVVND